ncbi:MAG: 1-phosphofructokinase family hexose kinase [Actinomycetota bacterium]|nr:1-phosphofructokinase family hexose kinase [Actinomycetota bacterium]
MIYTLTLNPTLDITYSVDELSFDEPVKAKAIVKTPGGKGLNVSRALHNLGLDSVSMTLLGGYTGEEVMVLLQQEGLILQVARISDETRTNVVIEVRGGKNQIVIRSEGPRVEQKEVKRISELLFDSSEIPEILVLSGSLPRGVNNDFYANIIERCRQHGIRVFLDSSGEPLRLGINAQPYLVKPNLSELEEVAGKKLCGEDEIISFSRHLIETGTGIVVVSLGSEGAIMVTQNEVLRGIVPRIDANTVGAGDSMVAGLLIGIMNSEPLSEIFKKGLSVGVATVLNRGSALADRRLFEKALEMVKVQKVE